MKIVLTAGTGHVGTMLSRSYDAEFREFRFLCDVWDLAA